MRRLILTVIVTGFALTLVVGAFLYEKRRPGEQVLGIAELSGTAVETPESFPAAYPRTERPAPAIELVGHDGRPASLAALRGRPVIVSFAFAHCSAVCPTLVKTLSAVHTKLAAQTAPSIRPATLVVTLDPENDTPAETAHLAATWGMPAGMIYASGPKADVEGVLDAYKVPRGTDEKTGEIAHPALVYVLDAEGRITYTLNNPTALWLEEAVRRAAGPVTH